MKNLRLGASGCLRHLAAFFSVGLLTGLPVGAMADANQDLDIVALSSPPNAVSGGTVLVRIELPRNVPSEDVIVILNSQATTGAFRPEASGHSLVGLVSGLVLGKNSLINKLIGS